MYNFTANLFNAEVMQNGLITVKIYQKCEVLLVRMSTQINLRRMSKISAINKHACEINVLFHLILCFE